MLSSGMMEPRPTTKNGHEWACLEVGIYNFLKAARLMRLMVAPPTTRMWYSLMLAMVEEMSSGSYLGPVMFLGQSEVSKPIDISIHLWWGAALGTGAATATTQRRVLMMHPGVISQEPLYMTWSILWGSLVLELESEWPYVTPLFS
jgi:hypothetical protein